MRGHIVLFLAAIVGLTPRATWAQDLAPGQRIRVRVPGVAEHPVIGTVVRYDSTTLWVQRDSTLDSIPLHAIRALERSDGSELEPVDDGLLNLVFLSGLGVATYEASESNGCNSTVKHIGCGLLGVIAYGFIFGETVEQWWPHHSVETWVKVPVRSVSLRPVFSHGVGLAVAIGF